MPPIHLLSDVDVVAVSIVDKAANRKRFYLRKNEDDQEVFDVGEGRLVKSEGDWTTVYAVVAEPGWRENAGAGSPGITVEDEWESEDEIRRAAHRFMKNGALVNRMHESLAPYGAVVENFVAQADFAVGDEVIKAGSWVIGIEPSDEGRQKIEAGEFTGVSIQGVGMRKLVEKGTEHAGAYRKCKSCDAKLAADAKKCHDCGATYVAKDQGKQFGPLQNLIRHHLKKPHPFTACVRDNRKRFGSRAEQVCARLKDIGLQTTKWRKGGQALAKSDGDLPDDLYNPIAGAWFASGLTLDDATMALEAVNDADNSLLHKIAVKVGVAKCSADCGCGEGEEIGTVSHHEEDDDMPLTDEQIAALNKVGDLEEKLNAQGEQLTSISESLDTITKALAEKNEETEEKPDREQELLKQMDELEERHEELRKELNALAEGQSTQTDTPDNVTKNDPEAALATALLG